MPEGQVGELLRQMGNGASHVAAALQVLPVEAFHEDRGAAGMFPNRPMVVWIARVSGEVTTSS